MVKKMIKLFLIKNKFKNKKFISNKDNEILERREEAYKLFIENYTWNSIGKKYKRIIEKVVEKDERK